MRFFFKCVAEAIVENGLKGLAEMVPGGKFAYDVAEGVWKKYKEQKKEDEQREELAKLAQATLEEAKAEAVKVAREAVSGAEDIIDLELYLTAIPDSVRQSLKRPEDPTGKTVPAAFTLKSADDVLKLLPPRPPRFRPGLALPGKPGWVLDRLLGTGGFGEVWFARHARLKTLFGAVKFCFGQSARDLIHEADLIDRVLEADKHPRIVPLLDAHLEGSTPWLMFEYVGGGTLADYIHRLTERHTVNRVVETVAMLTLLGEAVDCFHSLPTPVVHRDLKPSNVLLDLVTKRYRITDFGIGALSARETNRLESQGLTTRGGYLLSALRGSYTQLYSSPQQRRGADPDPRDDVHALGVMAYQMLVGTLDTAPGPRAIQTLKKMEVPDALAELVVNCTSEEPGDRPATAGQLVEQLRAIETDERRRLIRDINRFNRADWKEEIEFLREAVGRYHSWLTAAKSDDGDSMPLVAAAKRYGIGTEQDLEGAVRWWKRAAETGDTWSMCDVALAYIHGDGVLKDVAEGHAWLYKAKLLGSARAQFILTESYFSETSTPEDNATAIGEYLDLAENGYVPAMMKLACGADSGKGMEMNRETAMKWYRAAAKAGNEEAKESLKRLRSTKRPENPSV